MSTAPITSLLRSLVRTGALQVPQIRRVVLDRDRLREEVVRLREEVAALQKAASAKSQTTPQYAPPGHFYSPIPSLEDVRKHEGQLFGNPSRTILGIDLNEKAQLALLERFKPFYDEQPFTENKVSGRRYFFENPAYSYSDALFLYCMIRHAQPKRIIEVGSGYSSCVTLDTNELYFHNEIACTFVEPYPNGLLSLLRQDDLDRIELVARPLQEVDIKRFSGLEKNDILFIDSTHVSKIGSDVNRIILEILASLRPGVYIHFHDIFYPFEYPAPWIYEGRAWTEAYLLRAFLEFNTSFEIVFFNTFLEIFYPERFAQEMPLCLKNPGGSIWLRRAN